MTQASAVKGGPNTFVAGSVFPLVEPSARWVRVKVGQVAIADSRRALLLREYGPGRLPTYFFPLEDVRIETLKRMPGEPDADGVIGRSVRDGNEVIENSAWGYETPPAERAALAGHLTFAWNKGLQWFEEDEEVFVHARDPYKRADTLRSSRHVKVVIDGETVAETRRATLLFETAIPTRYYIPAEDVRQELLVPSELTTRCPYKGIASYWSVRVGDTLKKNLIWVYREPIPEIPKIKGLLCFYNERVDLYVDGKLQERPQTSFARD
jgi:uncharacterized protein (DUF427 family)